MSDTKIASLASLGAALAILMSSYIQWWRITMRGQMVMHLWMKWVLGICIGACILSALLILSIPLIASLLAALIAAPLIALGMSSLEDRRRRKIEQI